MDRVARYSLLAHAAAEEILAGCRAARMDRAAWPRSLSNFV
jgi:hypothetical protein